MNALFELLGQTLAADNFNKLVASGTDFDDYEVKLIERRPRSKVEITPKWEATATKEWFKRVKFAVISCGETQLRLPSHRDEEDEKEFYEGLASIDYDPGYGLQELFGIVVFNDHSWLSRGEYDGSEWWQLSREPQEKDWIE